MKNRCLLFLLIVVSFWGCNGHEEYKPISKNQWEIFAFIPKDSKTVTYINYESISKSEFWNGFFKNYFNQSEAKSWLRYFKRKTGLRLESSVHELITSSTLNGKNFLAISLNSDYKKLLKLFNDKKQFSSEIISGKKIFQFYNSSKELYYFINDSTLAMFSDRIELTDVLKNKNETLKTNDKFLSLIKKIKQKNLYWTAVNDRKTTSSVIDKIVGNSNDWPGGEIIKTIEQLTLSADLNDKVNIQSELVCESKKNAYLLTAGISSALAMGIISEKNNMLGKLTKNLSVSSNNNAVELQLELSKNEIKELNKIVKNNNQNKNLKQL